MFGLETGTQTQIAQLALALFEEKVRNEAAIELSPTVGKLMLTGAVALVVMLILHSQWWRRWWLTAEDPRSMGLYRIVFGFFVICNVNDFWEYFTFLFTDEGIFTADLARQLHASSQFAGFGDGLSKTEPWGFFDAWGVLEFLKGPKYSLLYFWDTPTFFWCHLWAFEICAVLFMIGFRTRLMGVLTFLLMNSIFFRNHLFWEGTELVYRVFLAYLICARSGHAYSVDNWLRCRKLRKQGRLSERDGPGEGAGIAPSPEHPQGLDAVYRLIPAWPRRLAVLQLCTVYAFTGIVKNGSVWARGDAIYYAWNMDHFYRFYPQQITAALGTNVMKLVTWTSHWGEAFFWVCALGLFANFGARQALPRLRPLPRLVTHLCWATLIGVAAALVWVTWPVHVVPNMPRAGFVGILVGLGVLAWGVWTFLGVRPIRVRSLVIDRSFIASWVLGRRIWIPWHISLMGGIFVLMNIGQFQTGMLSQTIVFFTGMEIAKFGRFIGRRLSRLGIPMPASIAAGLPPLPAEDPSLPHLHRDRAQLPQWAMFIGLAIFLLGVGVRIDTDLQWEWRWIWLIGIVFLGGVSFQQWRTSSASQRRSSAGDDPYRADAQTPIVPSQISSPWAYGPFGRFVVSSLLIWHIAAVATWVTPDKDCLRSWRGDARKVFTKWLTVTQTDQGWGMFAPNPPRSNVFLKVLVTTEDGNVTDLRTDVYAPERKPIPFVWNDRMRKMNRRIIGGESGPTSWYRKWYARYICRQWALEHGGETPTKVDLVKLWYKIPPPEETARKGWYKPEDLLTRTGKDKIEHTERCKTTVMGQLPDWLRQRHGLPPLPADLKYRPWIKHKKKKWEKRRAKERGEDPSQDSDEGTKKKTKRTAAKQEPVKP